MEADSNLACLFGWHPSFSPSSKDKYSRPIHDVVIDSAGSVEVMQIVGTVVNLNLDMPEHEIKEIAWVSSYDLPVGVYRTASSQWLLLVGS